MSTKLNQLSETIATKVRSEIESRIRQRIASGLNEIMEDAVRTAIDSLEISIDSDTMEVTIKAKR
jgi:hypothetical protein